MRARRRRSSALVYWPSTALSTRPRTSESRSASSVAPEKSEVWLLSSEAFTGGSPSPSTGPTRRDCSEGPFVVALRSDGDGPVVDVCEWFQAFCQDAWRSLGP